MLNLQQQCFNSIKTLCSNFKKDGVARKTESYLLTRLQSLEDQWKDFKDRHEILIGTIEDKNITYFQENIFEKTMELYETTKKSMNKLLQDIRDGKNVHFDWTGMMDDNADANVATLLERQECNFKALDRVMSKIDIKTITERWELQDYLSILKSKWENIDKLHWELEAKLKGSNVGYYNMFTDIEEKYDELRRQLNTKIWSTTHYEKSAPKIEVPEFSGNYMQWISFKDLFLETIHNNPMINKAQKMQHLKTKLKGEAERLVQHLHISAEHYDSCWEILTQRYDNRRLQFTSFINTMLNLPVIQTPDSYNLKRMHDVISECFNGLSNIAIDTSSWDPLIVHLMSQKLDSSTYSDYMKEQQDHRELPNLNDFLYYLESKFMAYESMKNAKKEITNPQKQNLFKPPNYKNFPVKKYFHEPKKSHTKTYFATTSYGQCPNCSGSHVLMLCPKFISMNTTQRNYTVAKLHLCENCLYSHGNDKCNSTKTCKECNMRHHTLLHNYSTNKSPPETSTSGGKHTNTSHSSHQTQANMSSNHLTSDDNMEILLTTVQLQVQTANGNYVTLRALLDQGSQVNLITESAAQLLKLPRHRVTATISGVGAASGDCKGKLQLICKSIHSEYTFETQALIMKKLINNLPNSSFKTANWPHLENLKLADPEFNVSRPVDLLLGADVYSNIILDGVLKGNQRSPIAQQTHLGWILCGKLKTFNCHVTLIDLKEITKYWEHEDITQDDGDTPEDEYCENHYSRTVQRAEDGKYVVKMPLSPKYEEKLGKTRPTAISQFLQLEKRLQRKNTLAAMYRDFIREYIELGHMKPAPPMSSADSCYLPHHGVLREQSTTTKLRVVFNASQKTSSGYSLNQVQEKGNNLQKDIQALIMKWRSYKYVYTADIEKMYRCIWLSEEQQKLQKIIWRDSPTDRLQDYQLCTVTYGMKSAPWLAMRTLKQLAIDDGHKHPEAAHILQNQFYVDDLISGHNSIAAANQLQKSIIDLLHGGGMNLRKWSSNHPALLENLSKDQISTQNNFDFKHEESTKTLGLGWNPQADIFSFNWNVDLQTTTRQTKRHLLSAISKLYDPLGWLSPITVTAKLLFQRVWVNKLGWDEILPADILNEWLKLKTELPMVKEIKIKRWLGGTQDNIELLGYCDASEKAYSCVIYSRVANAHGPPTVTILAAKTRVAPLAQKTTLPRLELCGALLLTQLVEKTIKAYKGHHVTVHAWCDSQVVLAWLQGDVSRWERYVANRVTKIKKIIPSENWNYIKSENNPADCASRGLYPSKLINFDLWWKGPYVTQTTNKDEIIKNPLCLTTTNTEIKKPPETTLLEYKNYNFIIELLNKCSSLSRVIRVTAWALRFTANLRNNDMKLYTDFLATSELATATQLIIKCVQQNEFENEYKLLLKKQDVSNKSAILKLNPYMDDKGIIRVGGRLNNTNLPFEIKNPIILSRNGRFTQLLIDQAHATTLHGGARLTLSHIRQRYWIVGGNRAVKDKLRHCVRCHRHKPTEAYQLMSDLPPYRTTPSRPFTHTGVDFTGHVEVKLNKGRGVKTSKGYIVIFVCMATKAVHIELASDLSTETFIAAFKRMCARRGTPKHVYSDCGTNFVGAAKVLHKEFEEFKQLLQQEFFNEINNMEIEWHFNAPAWPTAGGLWEAAVKSLKYHLRRVLGDQKLTYEEFTTLLTQIEACMNSRPLCPLTEDPDEFYNYLTPGHFLTGGPVLSLPLSDYSDVNTIDLRRRWHLTENMIQQFWKSWSNEYLTQLQSRSKWNKPTKNIREGDVVLVRDNNLPPGKWAMGRVLEVHPGSDGLVRVTTLKTQTGIIQRPITKLSPLPLDSRTEEVPENKTETKKQHSNKPRKTKKVGKSYFTTLFTTLITMFTLTTGARGSPAATSALSSGAHITSLEHDRPIYYDTLGEMQTVHDEWTLLMYYNLTNYWSNVLRIETYLYSLTDTCHRTDPRYCKTTLEQLSHEMDLLNYYNSILLAPHKHLSERKRRGLVDGIGNIANSLFGILDQQFANKYQKDITAIQNNENYLLELLKNQTSVVELENKVLKKTEDNINKQLNMIDEFMNQTDMNLAKVESTMEAMMASSYFNSASLATYLLLKNMKNMQEMLFDSLTDVYKGHMDVHLLSPVDLIKQLDLISGRLPKFLTLPVENARENIKDIYKLIYVKARVTDTYFLFEVHVPLTSDEDYSLYRAVPLPVKTDFGATMVRLQSQYIAVNFHKNTYISVSDEDVKMCTQMKTDRFICYRNLPVFNLHNGNAPCEAKLLSHDAKTPCDVMKSSCDDGWVALHSANSWLAVCCGACTLRTVCDTDVTSHTLTTSSIVTLSPGCLLQSKDFTIYSHNEYNTDMTIDRKYEVPSQNSSVNNIVDLTYHRQSLSGRHETDTRELEEIETKLVSLKEREVLPRSISSHDIHQYTISYVLLGAVLIASITWVIKRHRLRCCNKAQENHTSVYEDIELQHREPTPALPAREAPRPKLARAAASTATPAARTNVAFTFDE